MYKLFSFVLFCFATSAHSAYVYTAANLIATAPNPFGYLQSHVWLDLFGNATLSGITEGFNASATRGSVSYDGIIFISANAVGNYGFVGASANVNISANANIPVGTLIDTSTSWDLDGAIEPLPTGIDQVLAFRRLNANSTYNYGWVRYNNTEAGTNSQLRITGYAIETTENSAISVIPEPASLALIGLGFVAMGRIQRRKNHTN
jgi:hypothetical protein